MTLDFPCGCEMHADGSACSDINAVDPLRPRVSDARLAHLAGGGWGDGSDFALAAEACKELLAYRADRERRYGDWVKHRKIAQMPGTERTPTNALASTLEKARAGRIKSVYLGIQWDDDTFCGDWSVMARKDLAVHALMAQKNAMAEIDNSGVVV